MKECSRCGETKSLSEFSPDAKGKLGRQSSCKLCRRIVCKNYIANNASKRKDTLIKYRSKAETKAKLSASFKMRNSDEEFKNQRRESKRTWRKTASGKNSHKFHESNRRVCKLKATPSWANLEKIKEIYMNCPDGYHVDHIIPIRGRDICGLHIPENLQYLPAIENVKKGNRYNHG